MAIYGLQAAMVTGAPVAGSQPNAVAASGSSGASADNGARQFAGGSVGLGILVGFALYWIWGRHTSFQPQDGTSMFAVFYVAAQAIERLLEPIVPLIAGDKANTVAERDKAVAAAAAQPTDKGLAQTAANKQAEVDQLRANRAVKAWGVAFFLAVALCGSLGLLMLESVGVSGAPAWFDMILTALVISGGSKPLHDLISNIEKSKEAKEDPSATRK